MIRPPLAIPRQRPPRGRSLGDTLPSATRRASSPTTLILALSLVALTIGAPSPVRAAAPPSEVEVTGGPATADLTLATTEPATTEPVTTEPVTTEIYAAALRRFLAALDAHPELRAAEAALEAAERQLRAAYDPVALEASGAHTRLELDEGLAGVQLPDLGGAALPETQTQLAATLIFRPYPFGDVADAVRGRELEVQSRLLELREARAGLEARALTAALQAELAERSVALAETGQKAAQRGLEAARRRLERGGATKRELREAQAALREAEALLQNARADAATARRNLQALVGDTPAPAAAVLAAVPPPDGGVPAALRRAEVPVLQAELGVVAAERALWPVAQVSYAWNLSDEAALTASLESRTLQPSLGVSYRDPGRSFPESAVRSSLTVGVSANLSVGALSALEAAARQVEAARAGLEAAREGAVLQEAALRAAYDNAARDLEGARRAFEDAELTYAEARTREELGLASPLETQGALLELLQADLGRRSAELAALSALLELYTLYALPLSEALEPPSETQP
jgi:outer membrane protein